MDRDEFIQLVEALPVGVFVCDREGKPHYANEAARTLLGKGIVEGTVAGRLSETYRAYLAGTDQLYPIEKTPILLALAGQHVYVDDIEIRRPDRTIPLEVTASPIRDAQGAVVYGVAVFREIGAR